MVIHRPPVLRIEPAAQKLMVLEDDHHPGSGRTLQGELPDRLIGDVENLRASDGASKGGRHIVRHDEPAPLGLHLFSVRLHGDTMSRIAAPRRRRWSRRRTTQRTRRWPGGRPPLFAAGRDGPCACSGAEDVARGHPIQLEPSRRVGRRAGHQSGRPRAAVQVQDAGRVGPRSTTFSSPVTVLGVAPPVNRGSNFTR